MSNYRNSDFLNDFTTRTKANLKVIDNLLKAKTSSEEERNKLNEEVLNAEIYEVTQRINSFFGFVILPFEKYNFNFSKYKSGEYRNKLCQKCIEDKAGVGKWIQRLKDIFVNCAENQRFYCNYDDMTKPVREYDFEHVVKTIKHLRNSIAHGGNQGVMFYPLGSDYEKGTDVQIKEIIFHDTNTYDGKEQEFCIKLYIGNELDVENELDVGNELDDLWEAIVNLFIRIELLDINLKGRLKAEEDSEKTIKRLNEKMKNYYKLENERFYSE